MLESYIAAMKHTHFLLVYIQEDKRQWKDLMNAEEGIISKTYTGSEQLRVLFLLSLFFTFCLQKFLVDQES